MLDTVRSSNLNFHIQLSPFSAIISLKKSLIKDKVGNYVLPQFTVSTGDCEKLKDGKIEELEQINAIQKEKYEEVLAELEVHRERAKLSEISMVQLKADINTKYVHIEELKKEKESLSNKVCDLNQQISDMQNSHSKESSALKLEHKDNIKSLNKQLDAKDKQLSKVKKDLSDKVNVKKKSVKIQVNSMILNNSKEAQTLEENVLVEDDENRNCSDGSTNYFLTKTASKIKTEKKGSVLACKDNASLDIYNPTPLPCIQPVEDGHREYHKLLGTSICTDKKLLLWIQYHDEENGFSENQT